MPLILMCSSVAWLDGVADPVECQRVADHGGKWHKNGDVRWRVTERKALVVPAEPHLHALQLRVTGENGPIGTLVVPLACGTGAYRQAFARQYAVPGGALISIAGEVT